MSTQFLHGRPYAAPGPRRFDPAAITWSIGGKACEVDWDSFEATAPGGYGQFQGKAKPTRGIRHRARQSDHVIGHKPNGSVCYEGRLTQDAKYVDNVAYFTAMGPRTEVDGFNERLPYQIRDASQWHELHSDPATFASNSPKFQIAQKGNSIGVVADSNQSYSNGDNQGYYLWVQGWDVSNTQYTVRKNVSNSAFDLRVRRSDDDFTAPTTVATHTMGAGTPDNTDENDSITASASIVIIDWNANTTPATVASNNRFWVQGIRVGVITDQDTFSSSEVAQDVAGRVGYEADTVGATNMLPLDWNAPASDLLNYLGDIEDQVWLVVNSDKKHTYGRLIFRNWGHRTWHTSLGDWAEDQGLEVQPIFNRVTTEYQNPPGVQQRVRSAPEDFGLTDPLPGKSYDWPEPLQLEDPQPNDTLATAVNAKALSRLIKPRLRGSLKVNFTSKGVPFDIWPGDLIAIGGFEPKMPPQRIAAVTYHSDGSVTLNVGLDYSISALVDKRITKHLKRRNRRR